MNNSNVAGPQLRIRLTITEQMRASTDRLSAAMGLPDTHILLYALATGLRALDMSMVNPINLGVLRELENRLDVEGRGALADAGIKPRS